MEQHQSDYIPRADIPTAVQADQTTTRVSYWDEKAQKPFQILPQDINFCRDLGVPLPSSYYMRRIQENFRWMPYNGVLRTAHCAKSGVQIQTSWPAEHDARILCESEYQKIV